MQIGDIEQLFDHTRHSPEPLLLLDAEPLRTDQTQSLLEHYGLFQRLDLTEYKFMDSLQQAALKKTPLKNGKVQVDRLRAQINQSISQGMDLLQARLHHHRILTTHPPSSEPTPDQYTTPLDSLTEPDLQRLTVLHRPQAEDPLDTNLDMEAMREDHDEPHELMQFLEETYRKRMPSDPPSSDKLVLPEDEPQLATVAEEDLNTNTSLQQFMNSRSQFHGQYLSQMSHMSRLAHKGTHFERNLTNQSRLVFDYLAQQTSTLPPSCPFHLHHALSLAPSSLHPKIFVEILSLAAAKRIHLHQDRLPVFGPIRVTIQ